MSKKKKKEKKSKLYNLIYCIFSKAVRMTYRIHITGAEHLPEGGAVICANHIGYPDCIMMAAVLPRQIHYLAKEELFRIPFLGGLIRTLGAMPIKRNSADVGAIKEVVSATQNGRLVAVFPQGHRRHGQNPADTEIKHGIGMIAYRSEMPVVPICIKMKNERYALFRRIDIIVGEPMMYTDVCDSHSTQDYKVAARAFFNRVCELGGYTPSLLTEGAKE